MLERMWGELGLMYSPTTASARVGYTSNETLDHDFLRLFAGRADWYRIPLFAGKPIKKKIIITHPGACLEVFSTSSNAHQEVIHVLLSAGFECYVWTGALTQLNKEENIKDQLSKMEFISKEKTLEILKDYNISKTEIFDYDIPASKHLVKRFVEGEIASEHTNSFPIAAPLYKLPSSTLANLLSSLNPKDLVIEIANESDIDKILDNPLLKKFISTAANIKFNNISLIEVNKMNKIFSLSRQLQVVTLPTGSAKHWYMNGLKLPNTLKQFTIIKCNDLEDWQAMKELTKDCQLEKLEILNGKLEYSAPEMLPSIKTLAVYRNKSNPQVIPLVGTPNVENFIYTGSNMPAIANLKNLKTVTLSFLDSEFIDRGTFTSDKIESLSIDQAILPKDVILPKSLKHLKLTYCNLYWHEILKVATQCPNLESLEIEENRSYINFPFENIIIHENPNLKKLCLNSLELNINDLMILLNCSPNIEELSLVTCSIKGVPNSNISLNKLKKLNIRTMAFPTDSADFQYCFPQLEELCLINASAKNVFHPGITKIIVESDQQITLHSMISLATSCPNLSLLDLSKCSQIRIIGLGKLKKLTSDRDFLLLTQLPAPANLEPRNEPELSVPADKIEEAATPKKESLTLNKETNDEVEATFECEEFFYKKQERPSVNHFRLNVDTDIKVNSRKIALTDKNEMIAPFYLETENINLDALYQMNYQHDPKTWLGKFTAKAGSTDWIAIPSLTSTDKLLRLQSNPQTTFDIGYCKEKALYYIKPTKQLTTDIKISFMIEADLDGPKLTNKPLTPAIKKMIQSLRFVANGQGELVDNDAKNAFTKFSAEQQQQYLFDYFSQCVKPKDITPCSNEIDFLNTILQEQGGVCLHSTMTYIALAKALDLPARAISNGAHAFIETKIGAQWVKGDLGGGRGIINTLAPPPLPPVADLAPAPERHTFNEANRFKVWETVRIDTNKMSTYVKRFLKTADHLAADKKNILCVINPAQIESFNAALMKGKKKHCFYLHDLNQLTDKVSVVKPNGSCPEEDSPLARFIKNAKPGDVLAINWSDYQTEHVGYNSIMEYRMLKNIPIPPGVIVVGLLDQNTPMGDDFYSRFRSISECKNLLTPVSFIPENMIAPHPTLPIPFYDEQWQSVLIGPPGVAAGHFNYPDSDFAAAIKKNQSNFTFRNAPWHLPEFRVFMTELVNKKYLYVNGVRIPIPENFKIYRDDSPFEIHADIVRSITYQEKTNCDGAYVLNRMTLPTLFKNFMSEEQKPSTPPGILEVSEGTDFSFIVTENLSDAEWAHITSEAKRWHVSLELIITKGVTLPKAMNAQLSSVDPIANPKNKIITTNDIDYISDTQFSKVIKIPVNEQTSYAELVGKTTLFRNPAGELQSDYQPGNVLYHLMKGNTVILKGNISEALARQLESLFIPSPYLMTNSDIIQKLPGKLVLITEQKTIMPGFKTEDKTILESDLWDALKHSYNESSIDQLQNAVMELRRMTNYKAFSYFQLQTMLEYMKFHPHSNPLKSILRSSRDYHKYKNAIEVAWRIVSPHAKPKLNMPVLEKRHHKLVRLLKNDWYVFVVGPSGVGKTTTILDTLNKMGYEPVLHQGSLTEKLKAWVQGGAKRALFLDEVNLLEPGALDVLETLYQNPPHLILDGKVCTVPPDNRLIMAGNFAHYRDRNELRFIARHGQTITFKEFEDDFLRDSIMKPVLRILGWQETKTIEDHFLKVYHHINQQDPENHPLTPRNLQMMLMRFHELRKLLLLNEDAMKLAAYDEVSGMLSKDKRSDFKKWLNSEVGLPTLKDLVTSDIQNELTPSYPVTRKRLNPVRILNQLFAIREYRKNFPELAKAGCTGILIEGNPGEGKSMLVISYLKSLGYVDGDKFARNEVADPSKRYYVLKSTKPEEIDAVMLKAFHEGAWLVIDEINTLAIEHKLNFMMSGTTPEGMPAKNKGFGVAATQNPISFDKRKVLSGPFLNRFHRMNMKDYKEEDLKVITKAITGSFAESEVLVGEYLAAKDYADNMRIARKPTPRDLFEKAGEYKNKKS